MTILLMMLMAMPAQAGYVVRPVEGSEPAPIEADALAEAREAAWSAYREASLSDPTLLKETGDYAMTFGEATMRYTVEVIGDRPEDGYPLYIAMHGGGSGDTPDINDEQWDEMKEY